LGPRGGRILRDIFIPRPFYREKGCFCGAKTLRGGKLKAHCKMQIANFKMQIGKKSKDPAGAQARVPVLQKTGCGRERRNTLRYSALRAVFIKETRPGQVNSPGEAGKNACAALVCGLI